MLVAYSIVYTIGFALMVPAFLLNRQKYASSFRERLGNYPEFKHDDRKVIWLHCVSVGETNAARPLVDNLFETFPNHRLIISTTTKTGKELAGKIFAGKADAVFYFPFDWKFSVQRALENFKPSLVLLMETEIWPRLIHEAKQSGGKIAIVNGRLSENSFRRYSKVRGLISRVLADVDLALMQTAGDAKRINDLGMNEDRTGVIGNLKFDQATSAAESELTEYFRNRFGFSSEKPLIIAASTHEPEEQYVLDSLEGELGHSCRLLIAPRHPERFDSVAKLLVRYSDVPYSYTFIRRSSEPADTDKTADIILLDSIGELRSAYPLAEIVFVGGSLIPHGGQSVLEPATEGKAIVTGPYTFNFDSVLRVFLDNDAIRQTPEAPQDFQVPERLFEEFMMLLEDKEKRTELGNNAALVMEQAAGDATEKTIDSLKRLV